MAAPYMAYLPTSGCRGSRSRANVSSLLMRQKANPQYSFKSAPYPSLYGYIGSAHRCRRFYITNLMPVDARRGGRFLTALSLQSHGTIVLTRSNEGLSAPLASLYTVFFGGISIIRLSSYRHKALRYLLGRGILQIVVSAMPERTYLNKHYYCADPICALVYKTLSRITSK